MRSVTEWFPCWVRPVHVGFYQRQYGFEFLTNNPDYWDGSNWFAGCLGHVAKNPAKNDRPWRGLAEKPA